MELPEKVREKRAESCKAPGKPLIIALVIDSRDITIMTSHSKLQVKKRIAFLDFLFCWPPKGGADVDVYSVLSGLQKQGVALRLFVLQLEGYAGRGEVEADSLPFPVEIIPFTAKELKVETMAAKINEALAQWDPAAVMLTHGYFLKTALIPFLSSWKLIGRYYANELYCLKDAFHFRDGQPCPRFVHGDGAYCSICAWEELGTGIKSGQWDPWTHEYLLTQAWEASFVGKHCEALDSLETIVVYNNSIKKYFSSWQDKTVVIPGAVSLEAFPRKTLRKREAGEPLRILMTGRVEDPLKGLDVLRDACAQLREKGLEFEVMVTHFDPFFGQGELLSTGWLSHERTMALYGQADIVVVPSLWEEAFGLVAVEAMAHSLPVCASRTGGLQEIILDGETGGLFEAGNSGELAQLLEKLLKDELLRERWGQAGRNRVEACYTWDRVIEQHYMPLLEEYLS